MKDFYPQSKICQTLHGESFVLISILRQPEKSIPSTIQDSADRQLACFQLLTMTATLVGLDSLLHRLKGST